MTQEQTRAISKAFGYLSLISVNARIVDQDIELQECENIYTELRELVGQGVADSFKYHTTHQMKAQSDITEQASRVSNHLSIFCRMSDELEYDTTELYKLAEKLSDELNLWID